MNEELLRYWKSKGVHIIDKNNLLSYKDKRKTERHYKLKNLCSYVDFGCSFNGGTCSKYKEYDKKYIMCCCTRCAIEYGYYNDKDYIWKTDLKKLSELFRKKTGFWRKNKGCIIPYHIRSIICITHSCSGVISSPCRKIVSQIENALYDKRISYNLLKKRIEKKNNMEVKDVSLNN